MRKRVLTNRHIFVYCFCSTNTDGLCKWMRLLQVSCFLSRTNPVLGSASHPHPRSGFFYSTNMQKLTILFEGFIDKDGEMEQVVEHISVTVENCKSLYEALQAYVTVTGVNPVKHPKVVDMKYTRDL